MEYIIDAKGKMLGRVASQAAQALLGKTSPLYRKNQVADIKVKIINVGSLKISAKKKEQKEYKRYSGYPGGLKETQMKRVIEKKGVSEIVRIAVNGMIPRNRLLKPRMKNLEITE